jgi:cytochrome c
MSKFLDGLACLVMAAVAAGLHVLPLAAAPQSPAPQASAATGGAKRLGIGRQATPEEISGWDVDIRPDGQGLPVGRGTVKQGEEIYMQQCAACHGEFGESAGRWPILMGGAGTLASHDPVKSIGSYWPYASTVIDYIRRSMPFGNAQSLSVDELYAVTAYVLYLNDIIKEENFELNEKNFSAIKLPNEGNFSDDDREVAEKEFWRKEPCMKDCAPGHRRNRRRPDRADAPRMGRSKSSSARASDKRQLR